jgi:predicted lipoprotein with Yx(FWY)xxD motif
VTRLARRAALLAAACGTLTLASACGGFGATSGNGSYAADGGRADAAAAQPKAAEDDDSGTGSGSGTGYDAPAATPTPKPAGAPAPGRGALVAKTIPKMGAVATDAKGWVLYRFDKDSTIGRTSACAGTCARIWPPALTSGEPKLVGIERGLVGTIRRADGTMQLTLGGWPLYRYAGDQKPGQWKGQGVAGTWWVTAPNGAKNLTCIPKGVPTAVPAPPASGDSDY